MILLSLVLFCAVLLKGQDTMYIHQHNAPVLKMAVSDIDSIVFYPVPDSLANSTFEVKYQVYPLNNYFTKVTYNDKDGNEVVQDDFTGFQDGVLSFFVSVKPYTARITTEIANTTETVIYYDLIIYINGELKAFVQASAPAMTTSFVSTAEFTVE